MVSRHELEIALVHREPAPVADTELLCKGDSLLAPFEERGHPRLATIGREVADQGCICWVLDVIAGRSIALLAELAVSIARLVYCRI